MAGEGLRLDDLKRWKQGLARGAAQNSAILNNDGTLLTKAATENKFVWAIPARDITTNPNLKQNPGW